MSQKRLTKHASNRVHERFNGSNKHVKEVMMYGYPSACFEGPLHDFMESIKNRGSNAITVKVKGKMLVIYNKRSQRAITTFEVPEKYMPIENYLLKGYRKKANIDDNGSTEKSE